MSKSISGGKTRGSLIRPAGDQEQAISASSPHGPAREESGDDVILVKDRRGRVIGFERLNFLTAKQREQGGGIPLEVQMV